MVPAARFSWTSMQSSVARVESTPATPNIGYVIGVSAGVVRILVQVGGIPVEVPRIPPLKQFFFPSFRR